METSLLHSLLDFTQQHPLLVGLVVMVSAFAESLVIVGLFMPGTVFMFSFGALIGGGHLSFTSTMAWAVLGAIAGDGLSYWLGHHYRQRLKVMWPFNRYPKLIAKGTDFFTRHGGKSVVFGRFVGPVRPIIPAVAGMLGMPWPQFLAVNVLSAVLWAPAYLLPGMALGASLGLAAEVAGRLVVVLLLLFAILWAAFWLVRRALHYLQPRSNPLIEWALRKTRPLPYVGAVTEALLDPQYPEGRALTTLFLVLLVAVVVSILVIQSSLGGQEPGLLNLTVHNLVQELRTDSVDAVMLWVTQFGSLWFLLPFTVIALVALLAARDIATAIYLAALMGFAQLTVLVLKNLTRVPRPADLVHGLQQYSFPSGHALMSTVFFGFLAVVFAARLPDRWRWLPYSFATAIVSLVTFSRLYLGVHWLSDLVAGIAIGLAWTALAGIAYRRHHSCRLPAPTLMVGSVLALLASLWCYAQFAPPTAYLPAGSQIEVQQLSAQQWRQSGWRQLPAVRHDLRGFNDLPFNLQWAGKRESITQALSALGWQPVEPLDVGNALRYLSANHQATRLPVPSHIHDSHPQTLLYRHGLDGGERIAVVRLWPSSLRLPDDTPIWFGSISYMQSEQVLWMFRALYTLPDYKGPLQLLQPLQARGDCRPRHYEDGRPLLLCESGPGSGQ